MHRCEIILRVRTEGKLKGVKPVMVYLKNNIGKIYNEGYSDFIMSIYNDKLYFQKISFFMKALKPQYDFELNINRFKEYDLFEHYASNTLCLYDSDKRFIEIHYNTKTPDTAPGEDNMRRIMKILDEKGIKRIKLLSED